MNRKRACVLTLGALILAGAGLAFALRHEPTFYTKALADHRSPQDRLDDAQQFEQTALQLVNEYRFEDEWAHEITDSAVNAWLSDVLPAKFGSNLPGGLSLPRVRFEDGHLLLAVHIRQGLWQGVINSRVRAWISGPNELALDLETTRLGLIPIPVAEIIDDLVQKSAGNGWHAEWKNAGRRDVLVIHLHPEGLSADEQDQHAVLESLELQPGVLRISGRRQAAATDTATHTASRSASR